MSSESWNFRNAPRACFAALMPVYPACWTYNTVPGHEFAGLVDAPLLLVTGALDEYDDDAQAGANLVASLSASDQARVRTHAFADSHHCFDMPGVDVVVEDPMSHRGAGGKVTMRHNAEATARSHRTRWPPLIRNWCVASLPLVVQGHWPIGPRRHNRNCAHQNPLT